jgi:aspartate aminotransferase-like enzyme
MRQEGIENRWQRHVEMLAATSSWLETTSSDWGNIAPAGSRSPTVSTIRLPERIPGKTFVERVKARGIRVATGYGKLAGTTFRIGHMGDHTVATLGNCFAACEEALRD